MSKKHFIQIKKNDNLFYEYSISSKSDLYTGRLKEILQEQFEIKNSIRCMCDMQKELYLYVTQKGFVKKYPKSQEHDLECIFSSERKEFIDEETGIHKASIFDEALSSNSTSSSNSKQEKAKRLTYYDFCRTAISIATTEAFNYTNDDKTNESIENFSFDQFCFSLLKAMDKLKIKAKKEVSIKEYFSANKDLFFSFGMIKDDIFSKCDDSKLNDKDEVEINLYPIKYDKEQKQWSYNKLRKSKITNKRLKLTSGLSKIWDNSISPEYFYFAVYKDFKIVRFFIMPVCMHKNYITFVESDYEREYAKKLIDENIVFIKPISNDEIYNINPSLINSSCEFIPYINYHPDFLELRDNKLIITEVSGFDNKEYTEHMNKKIRYYTNYIKNKEMYFDFKKIDGKTLEEVESWTGEERLERGSFEGMKWKDIYTTTLKWYIDERKPYFRDCAKKELKRRGEYYG